MIRSSKLGQKGPERQVPVSGGAKIDPASGSARGSHEDRKVLLGIPRNSYEILGNAQELLINAYHIRTTFLAHSSHIPSTVTSLTLLRSYQNPSKTMLKS